MPTPSAEFRHNWALAGARYNRLRKHRAAAQLHALDLELEREPAIDTGDFNPAETDEILYSLDR